MVGKDICIPGLVHSTFCELLDPAGGPGKSQLSRLVPTASYDPILDIMYTHACSFAVSRDIMYHWNGKCFATHLVRVAIGKIFPISRFRSHSLYLVLVDLSSLRDAFITPGGHDVICQQLLACISHFALCVYLSGICDRFFKYQCDHCVCFGSKLNLLFAPLDPRSIYLLSLSEVPKTGH